MRTAFLFPGQGAQVVGMGREIAESFSAAAEIFDKANEIVGYDLRGVCFEGPAERLNSTAISQPAIFVACAAILEVVRTEPGTSEVRADVTAGLSLGEYTALYAAGVISFEDGVILCSKRGEAMQSAAEESDGGMVSLIGLDEEEVGRLCGEARQVEVLEAVNFNCPGQIVVSGSKSACRRAEELAEKYGAVKAIGLEVAGAFHTEMMASAAERLEAALSECEIGEPGDVKTIANVDAEYYNSSEKIRKSLISQLTCPILWQKCMERLLADGIEKFYEIGPGRVLTGLMRRISRKTEVINVSCLDALERIS